MGGAMSNSLSSPDPWRGKSTGVARPREWQECGACARRSPTRPLKRTHSGRETGREGADASAWAGSLGISGGADRRSEATGISTAPALADGAASRLLCGWLALQTGDGGGVDERQRERGGGTQGGVGASPGPTGGWMAERVASGMFGSIGRDRLGVHAGGCGHRWPRGGARGSGCGRMGPTGGPAVEATAGGHRLCQRPPEPGAWPHVSFATFKRRARAVRASRATTARPC